VTAVDDRQRLAAAFSAALNELVADSGLSFATIEAESGISAVGMAGLAGGTRLPGLDAVFVIADVLNIPAEQLIARTAIHIELKAYEHDVPIFFRRGRRVFRLMLADGRDEGCYEEPGAAIVTARLENTTRKTITMMTMPMIMAIAIYSRSGYIRVT
jgi:hypothetical protein